MAKEFTCCFCKNKFPMIQANNAEPAKKGGYCCDACNMSIVIPYRLEHLNEEVEEDNKKYMEDKRTEAERICDTLKLLFR